MCSFFSAVRATVMISFPFSITAQPTPRIHGQYLYMTVLPVPNPFYKKQRNSRKATSSVLLNSFSIEILCQHGSTVHRLSRLTIACQKKVGVMSAALRIILCLADHKRTISLNQNSSQFVNAAEASLYPNEFRSMASSIKALDDIGSSLADIEAFWRMESNELSASMGQLRHNLPSRDQIEARVNMWRRYQLGIVGSIPSITLAADAAKVGPIGAGQESKSSPTKRSGIWKRFIGMIAGRRAT